MEGSTDLDAFASLAEAVGLTQDGELNGAWFEDPLGTADGGKPGLRSIIYTDAQRNALLTFVDEVLGAPDREQRDESAWVPLFADSGATIFVVIEASDGVARIGFGFEYASSASSPSVSLRTHVPVFQLPREGGGSGLDTSGGQPDWLLLGRSGGVIEFTFELEISTTAPVAGELYLGGISLSACVPTNESDQFSLAVGLRRLQLPGTSVPKDLDLDVETFETLGSEVLEFLAGLIQAQAEALQPAASETAHFAALSALLGLRSVADIPPFPLEALFTDGISAVIGWLESIFRSNTSRDAWLGEFATLFGGTLDSARDAITFTVGSVEAAIGLRCEAATGGGIEITPWIEAALRPRDGAEVRIAADILSADTTTASLSAFPALTAAAVFGADAGSAPALLSGDPAVGSIHIGFVLMEGRPAFALTAHDVTLNAANHAVLDLSSPEAALDAVDTVVDAALLEALDDLGRPGELSAILLGLAPPAGIPALSATEVLSNPLDAVRGYWSRLIGDRSAFAEVLRAARELLTGDDATLSGAGSQSEPWRIPIDPAGLAVWLDDNEIVIDLGVDITTPVFDAFETTTSVYATLARFNVVEPAARFCSRFSGRLALRRSDGATARFDLGAADLLVDAFGCEVGWAARDGLAIALQAPGLALDIDEVDASGFDLPAIDIPLPTFNSDGSVSFTPDWNEIEVALAALLGRLDSAVIDVLLDLIGWSGEGARLRLAELIDDPQAALRRWLADLALDCDNVRTALGPVSYLLSGFQRSSPSGSGNRNDPFRSPVAGVAWAPGLAAWLEPGCPLPLQRYEPAPGFFDLDEPPEEGVLVAALRDAARALPELRDLLTGRDRLEEGLRSLADRFTGTDGVLARPAVLPDGVTGIDMPDYSYRELVAMGAADMFALEALDDVPGAIIHAGCEAVWADAFGADSIDARTTMPTDTVATSAEGRWSIALPLPADAAADRPDRGGIGEQAARLNAAIGGRSAAITVIAYGAAGAAAIAAANDNPRIERVITVGSPWGAVSVSGFTSGLSADALRLLMQIRQPVEDGIPEELFAMEADPSLQMRGVIDHAAAVAGLTDAPPLDMPDASAQARRPGLVVDAVFGWLDADSVETGMALVIADAIDYRYAQHEVASQPPQALRAGVDLPVFDLDLGGVLVGAGAIVELVSFDRGETGDGFAAHNEQRLRLDLHFGVTDGWLVGGPGALQNDIEVRWVSACIELPLTTSTRPSEVELVLHEANCFGVRRERWRVKVGDGVVDAAPPTPETHILMDAVVARLMEASDDLAALFTTVGLVRAGGYDPQGLERLLFDTVETFRGALDSDAAELADLLRRLGGFDGAGSNIDWTLDIATVAIDLQTRTITLDVSHEPADLPPANLSLALDATGELSLQAGLGAIDPRSGGIALQAEFAAGRGAGGGIAIAWKLPGAPAMSEIDLLAPGDKLDELVKLAAALIPATLLTGFVDNMRDRVEQPAREAIEGVLDGLSLLEADAGLPRRRLRVPWALFLDPGAWLRDAASAWVANPLGQAIATLDALVPLVAPDRAGPGWPLTEEVAVTYGVESGRLLLGLAVTTTHSLDSAELEVLIDGGIAIDASGAVSPSLSSSLSFDQRGISLAIAPTPRLALLRPSPATPLQIFPNGPGLGSLLNTAAGMAIPAVLNALIAARDDAAESLSRDVARTLYEVGSALELLEEDQFTESRVTAFAGDPVGALMAHLGQLVVTAVDTLADALDPDANLVKVVDAGAGRRKLGFGATSAFSLTLDGGDSGPAIEIGGAIDVADVGRLDVEGLRLDGNGVQVAGSFVANGIDVGNGLELMPVITIRAGVSGGGFERMVGVGLITDGGGDQSVECRWALDASLPRWVVVDRASDTENSDLEAVALALVSQAVSMATNVALDALDPLGPKVIDSLQGVVFSTGATLDPQLFHDFSDPAALLRRLYTLAFNLAGQGIGITIEEKLTVGFARRTGAAGRDTAGIVVSLADGERIRLGSDDPTVDLEIEASWITAADTEPGLAVYLLARQGDNFEFDASVTLAGLGVRVSKQAGPLLNLGAMVIDAIAVHTYGSVGASDLGGGVQVRLDGLAFSPSAGGGDNAVANNLMSDAADSASPSARPTFSPSFAVQKPPGGNVGVSLRAGDPPGPWWIAVQRQLGPLYLEQFGFDTTEIEGSVSGISLLFDARVSLFGLNAEVDQLGLHWTGGDIFDVGNWVVDLQGLGVSADMSGISISGGLLKTDLEGAISYVGMLMGRFSVYGLSLFGGYTDDNGSPSFFVFGAVLGPIGGPPAFFVTGIGGGLGINRGLRVPDDLSRFDEYPFIKALDPAAPPASSPLQELRTLSAYFPREAGNLWFAAGISFSSFALVDGVAVVSVSFGSGLEVNLFGLARMALPRPQAALVSIELGLLARFSTEDGEFLIQAQLTDNSWLLYPEVRLSGGFAFATWWKGPNGGQFVLTLGGYHPDFSRSGYPIVPRLGLVWRVTDDIVIKGGSYFALTSEALMAGVDIEVSADYGFAWARIAFGANAIVYFDPFYFIAEAYARIAAGLKIKTFLGTIRFSISTGARIEVEGPSFHGKAYIEIGPSDITVRFGSSNKEPGVYVDWNGFVPKYLEQSTPGRASVISAVSGRGSLPAATDGGTLAPSSDGSAERPFEVFAEFELTVVTTVPTTRFDFGAASDAIDITPKLSDGASTRLGLSPMNARNLTSTLAFRLEQRDVGGWTDRTDELSELVRDMREGSTDASAPTFGLDAFPIGVWGEPEDPDQPSSPLPRGDVISAASRLKMVAAASIEGLTGPEIDYDQVESGRRPLPLSATGGNRVNLLETAATLGVNPIAEDAATALATAESRLFGERHGAGGRGRRSAVARAAYARSRNAPPLFGTLAEGIAPKNPVGSDVTPMPSKPDRTTRTPRAPFVTGYLAVGAGVGARMSVTTVANRRIKRRPAPSTDSVRGRLGRSLPIKLTVAPASPVIGDQTVIVRGRMPDANAPGLARSYRGGHVGSTVGGALVAGLSTPPPAAAPSRRRRPRALEPGARLRAGDVVSLRLPDAAIDTVAQRPRLKVEGAARVVLLGGNGAVLDDRRVSDMSVEIPPGAAIVAAQADGGMSDINAAAGARVIGWHNESRVARLGGRNALAAGSVIHVEGVSGRARIGWANAGDIVRGAAAVATRFASAEARTIGVIVRGAEARRLADFGIELHGATRLRNDDGTPVKPVVVQVGNRSVLLFAVLADPDRNDFVVRVTSGGTRQVAGVIASLAGVDELADLLAERGVIAVTTRLRAVSGDGCSLAWEQPSPPVRGDSSGAGSSVDAGVARPQTEPRASDAAAVRTNAGQEKERTRTTGGEKLAARRDRKKQRGKRNGGDS